MARAVGIDLGTTYTVLAVIEGGQPRVILNAEGERLTPSVVAFIQGGQPLVGLPAKLQAAANPQRTIASIKRRMGSDHKVRVAEREYTPEEISSFILSKVKADAEAYLGETIDKAVITVPAYFNDRQRQATRQAGLLAGLEVLRIINEPTAAALAHGLDREDIHTILVWDLGGGTFDISILEVDSGILEVRAVSGDPWLGGDDYDRRLADYLAGLYPEPWGAAFRQDRGLRQRLLEAAEKAKNELSAMPWAQVCLPATLPSRREPASFKATVMREQFQALTRDLLERMMPPTEQALADAELKPGDIHRVLLVGGATRMPAVRELARELLGQEPCQGLNPDEAVALGAALQVGMLLGEVKRAILLDVLPLSLGVETRGGLFARVLRRNTHLPIAESRIFTTATDNQASMDIHVLQGERELALDNVSLGQFQLQGIPPLPQGVPKVEVTFEVDVDGILHVSARDLLTESESKAKMVVCPGHRPEETPAPKLPQDGNVAIRGAY